MTDLEKAVSKWLPDVWAPGRACMGSFELDGFDREHPEIWVCDECGKTQYVAPAYPETHNALPPPPSRELVFRLLEAMAKRFYFVSLSCSNGVWSVPIYASEYDSITIQPVQSSTDSLTAVGKAAAALADKEQG